MQRADPVRLWAVGLGVFALTFAVPHDAAAQQWYADWTCSGSQCRTVMGGSSGTAGPFNSSSECEAWQQAYIRSSPCRSGGPPGRLRSG